MGKARSIKSHRWCTEAYFEEDDVFYVPVGDAAAMREVVTSTDHRSRRLRAQSAQSKFIEQDGYSSRALIRQYAVSLHGICSIYSVFLCINQKRVPDDSSTRLR